MTNRQTFQAFKEKALQREEVHNEYNELKNQMVTARLAAHLSQDDVAKMLLTKKQYL